MSDANLEMVLELPERPSDAQAPHRERPFDRTLPVHVKLSEGISERTHASVDIESAEHFDFEGWLGEDARLSLVFADVPARTWSLKLGAAESVPAKGSAFRYRLELFDPAYLLQFVKSTRKFRGISAEEIVTRVLVESGVAHTWQLTRRTRVREYCTQYRETNLAFVERLLEFEGIFYTFDESGRMLLGDASEAAPRIQAVRPFELVESSGALSRAAMGIHELRARARVRSGKVTLGDYNWKKPELDLRQSAHGDRDGDLEWFEYPAGYRRPDEGDMLAKLRLEARRSDARTGEGKGNVVEFAPGFGFRFGTSAGDLFAGEFLLTRVEHTFQAARAGENAKYENAFGTMPLERNFRPKVRAPRPRVGGSHTAFVRGASGVDIHTDAFGRFKAQFHWDREATETDSDSRWIRVMQENATGQVLARTGWEMFIGYIDGDPDRPVGVARAINKVAPPTLALPGAKNVMTVRTPSSPADGSGGGSGGESAGGDSGGGGGGGSYNELQMDDSAGAQKMSLRAEKDLDSLVKNEKTETIGNDETHSVGTDFVRQVMGNQDVTIGGSASMKVAMNLRLTVQGDRSKKVGGSESVTVGGGSTAATAKNETERVGSVRITIAGSIKLPDFKAMAANAAKGFLTSLSPQAAAAYTTFRGLAGGSGVPANASSQATTALTTAGGAAISSFLRGGGVSGATSALGASLQGTAGSIIPSAASLANLVPSGNWIPTGEGVANAAQGALATATGGLSKGVSIDSVINLVAVGGIERAAGSSFVKKVGGAYISVAVLGIDTKVGLGYIETVGGAKLVLALTGISETVSGKLFVTVGALVLRTATAGITFSTKVNSSVKAGAMAKYEGKTNLEIVADKISIKGSSSVTLAGGGGEIKLSDSGAKLGGKLTINAPSGTLKIVGNKANVAK